MYYKTQAQSMTDVNFLYFITADSCDSKQYVQLIFMLPSY